MLNQTGNDRIDIHAHLLPGVDDGARTLEESCRLVALARQAGFCAAIVTPHYSRRRGTEGLAKRFEELKETVRQADPDFLLYLGQETYYHEELLERLKSGDAFTMAGSRYVLVEFDPGVSYQTFKRAVRRLTSSGYIPVIAHMERYGCLRDSRNLEEAERSGCLMQMNYESLQGHWLSSEVRWCRKQVREGRIHFLGTDMHRTDYRPPETAGAVKWLYAHVSHELADRMTFGNAERIIRNEKIS